MRRKRYAIDFQEAADSVALTRKRAFPQKRIGRADFPFIDKLRNKVADIASAPERRIFVQRLNELRRSELPFMRCSHYQVW